MSVLSTAVRSLLLWRSAVLAGRRSVLPATRCDGTLILAVVRAVDGAEDQLHELRTLLAFASNFWLCGLPKARELNQPLSSASHPIRSQNLGIVSSPDYHALVRLTRCTVDHFANGWILVNLGQEVSRLQVVAHLRKLERDSTGAVCPSDLLRRVPYRIEYGSGGLACLKLANTWK
jgi:hypothetical protein